MPIACSKPRKRASLIPRSVVAAALLALGLVVPVTVAAEPAASASEGEAYSPPLRKPPEKTLYWGDLHLHTNLSTDAYINGTTTVSQEDAYQFAMGETITADNGVREKLLRPLDFLAVTNHGENLGLYAQIAAGGPRLVGQPVGERWSEVLELSRDVGLRNAFTAVIREHGPMPDLPKDILGTIWARVAQTADRYNHPGLFTTLIGYEWTSMINGDNLHRVVLFRDAAEKAAQTLPISAQVDSDPESLWAGLALYEQSGGKVLAIAHNGNLSNGRKPDASGRVQPVGSTVDIENAAYRNSIGAPEGLQQGPYTSPPRPALNEKQPDYFPLLCRSTLL